MTKVSGMTLHRLLFLCGANYYLSRFCEELFNHYAATRRLPWQALSRALLEAPATRNVGPMSAFAIEQLRKRAIQPLNHLRLPLPVNAFDFETSELVIAVNEAEHRPVLESRWLRHAKAVWYWHVADIDTLPPRHALALAEGQVATLLDELAASRVPRPARLAG